VAESVVVEAVVWVDLATEGLAAAAKVGWAGAAAVGLGGWGVVADSAVVEGEALSLA
jgi:hypothetical protein